MLSWTLCVVTCVLATRNANSGYAMLALARGYASSKRTLVSASTMQLGAVGSREGNFSIRNTIHNAEAKTLRITDIPGFTTGLIRCRLVKTNAYRTRDATASNTDVASAESGSHRLAPSKHRLLQGVICACATGNSGSPP